MLEGLFDADRWSTTFQNMGPFWEGFGVTLQVVVAGLLLSLVLGTLLGVFSTTRSRVLRAISRVYVEFYQNTPLPVQVLFMYMAGPQFLQAITGADQPVRIAPFALGALGLLQLLGRIRGGGPEVLILFGVALNFTAAALLSLVQFVASADALQQLVFWTMGSLASVLLFAWMKATLAASGRVLLAVVLMIGSYIISVKRNYPKGDPFSIKAFVKQLGTSIWALAAVIIVVFGVVGGVFTATESAAIAVIYSLFVSVFVYKGLDWKGVWHALDECVNTLSIVLILIATSAVFGNCLTMLHVPDLAANAITSVTDNPYIIALLIDLIILVLGCIMDMAPIILIATPILLPIATSIGIDPIQFGIIVVLNCGIGLLTPPVGAVLFIGSAVAKRPMEKVVKATLPFYLCMFVALLLLTFVPDISLAIPKLLGGYVSPITNPLGPVFIH